MTIPKNLPTGFHTFENLITGGFIYVDKTELIYPLIKPLRGAYFLSRPRRFGKSLLVSTLKAIFEGKRDLFADLWLGQHSDYTFESYPVLDFDLSQRQVESKQDLKQFVIDRTNELAEELGVTLSYQSYEARFGELIRKLGQSKPVVILIDEYDKPLLDNILKPTRDEIRDTLKGFFTSIKAADRYLRFVLLTGVTKFSKMSIFSELNNLVDLTMDHHYATLLGFTQAELERYFSNHLSQLSTKLKLNHKALLAEIQYWYNGYRFSSEDVYVYNPFSTLLLLKQQAFGFYWFETGTPTFLLDLLKNKSASWREIPEEKMVSARAFSSYQIDNLQALPLLFQSGYLTIKDVDTEFYVPMYLLDYPNFEVKQAFLAELLKYFTDVNEESNYIYHLIRFFKQGNVDRVLEQVRIFFANIDYELELKNEKYYQTIFFALFELLGFNIKTEVHTNRGRIDAVVDMPDAIYLFEFKLFDTAEEALKQIKTNVYFEKYLKLSKTKVLIGVSFNQETRNIDNWLTERVNSEKNDK